MRKLPCQVDSFKVEFPALFGKHSVGVLSPRKEIWTGNLGPGNLGTQEIWGQEIWGQEIWGHHTYLLTCQQVLLISSKVSSPSGLIRTENNTNSYVLTTPNNDNTAIWTDIKEVRLKSGDTILIY